MPTQLLPPRAVITCLMLAAAVCWSESARAQQDEAAPPVPALPATEAEQARGLPIQSIEVAGLRRLAQEDVLRYLKQQVGEPFDPKRLAADVRELWTAGFFAGLEVDLDRREDGVALVFMVRERPTISKVEFDGNEEIGDNDLTEASPVKANGVLSRPAVQRAMQKVRDQYAEKGFFLAEVSSDVVPQRDNTVLVRFTVKEHSRVSVRRITFIGNEHVPEEELRALMFTGNAGILGFGSGGPFRQDAFERDIAVISALYYDRGFLSATVSTPRVSLTPDRSGIEVALTINEGPRFRIRTLRVLEQDEEGKEVEPIGGRRNLRNLVAARPGDYFNRAGMMKDLGAVRTLYRDAGYFNADAKPQTRLDPRTNEVDVTIPVIRGPKVFFERIEVRGNNKTRDRVVRRELEIIEGQPFSETLLERSKRRVNALGYFERVDVATEAGSEPDKLRVYVEVTERPTGTFQVGVGFSSIENFIATAQIQQSNLFGNGQSLSLQGQMSGLRQLIDLQLFEPYLFDSWFSGNLNLFNQLTAYSDFTQSSRGGAITVGYPLIQPTLIASMTYTASLDEVTTATRSLLFGSASSISVFQSLPLANLFNSGLTSSVRPTLTLDTRNNRLFPTEGIYIRASTELSSSALGADNEFLRHRINGRFYYDVGGGAVIKLNSNIGHVTSPKESGVPIFARFFLGGILDVRGFFFRSIGPRLPLTTNTDPNSPPYPNGANIGGNLMYYQNLEFEFPIVQSVGLRGVLFTDLGNAWNLESNYCDATIGSTNIPGVQSACFNGLSSLLKMRTSYGFGLRWFSPLGPLRFEWGFPFAPLPTEPSNRFEFTIGNFF